MLSWKYFHFLIQGVKFHGNDLSNKLDISCGSLKRFGTCEKLKNYFNDLDSLVTNQPLAMGKTFSDLTSSAGVNVLDKDCR